MEKVIVYSKPLCIQCDATYRALDKENIEYTVVNIEKTPEALATLISLGYKSAPVVTVGDQSWSGFRPDLIANLAKTHAKTLVAA